MRRTLLVAILPVLVLSASTQDRFFPLGAFSNDVRLDQFVSDWYSSKLKILEEPSLLRLSENHTAESYRFLWLRTFNNPVAVRLEIRHDGSAVLLTKVATGSGGFPDKNAHLVESICRPISREQVNAFQRQLGRMDFWTLSSSDQHRGTDGAEWIIEGVKEGKYHVVVRWSPKDGKIRELGLMLAFGFADLKIPKDDVY